MINNNTTNRSYMDLIPVCIIFASFGPYIFPSYGMRSEHILIYSLLLFAVPFYLIRQRFIRWSPPLLATLVLLIGITLWTMGSSMFGGYSTVSFSKYLSSLENYIQPIAVIILILVFARYASYAGFLNCFKRLCRILIFLLCLNSIIAGCSIFFDLSGFLRPFVFSCFGDVSVSELASSQGRYSGVFNQPFESGLTYSLGLLAWGYLKRVSLKTGFIDYCLLLMMIIGGALSVSKVFILGGIPLLIFYWNPLGNLKKYFNRYFFLAVIVGTFGILLLIQFWSGWDYLYRLFKIGGGINLVELYTGGRFGAEYSTMSSNFARVWQESPMYGFGFGNTSCFDNAYLEFFLQGGLIALFGYLILLDIYFWYSLRSFMTGYEEGRLLLAFFVLVMGGSFGAPVLTINRFSTIFWALSAFLFLMLQARRRDEIKKHQALNYAQT